MSTRNIKIMFLGSKVRRVRRADNCLDNVGSLTSHNPIGLHGLLLDSFIFFLLFSWKWVCLQQSVFPSTEDVMLVVHNLSSWPECLWGYAFGFLSIRIGETLQSVARVPLFPAMFRGRRNLCIWSWHKTDILPLKNVQVCTWSKYA
jgi:hypothetical protein